MSCDVVGGDVVAVAPPVVTERIVMEFLMLALGSFGLGALHALEPGHGKTVVGAYLVGSRGRASDAILLGVVVTLTHTGIVILLGVLSTVAAAYFVPETVQQVLEMVSGFLIVLVGGWMIGVRIRQARRQRRPQPDHSAAHDHDHGHDHDEEHSHDHHDHDKHGGHEHHDEPAHENHEHDHHDHGDDHDHDHGHSHAPVLRPGERPTLGQLIALGISGGIVPCPAALAVLLAAIAVGGVTGFVRGLSLVVIFSLGMAAALVAIGLVMVKAANFAGRYVAESRWTRIVPIFSAILITAIGVALTIRAFSHLQ